LLIGDPDLRGRRSRGGTHRLPGPLNAALHRTIRCGTAATEIHERHGDGPLAFEICNLKMI
jgi:hypothetical protein